MANRPLKHEDNAEGQLDSGISASTGTLALASGDGAAFPTTYTGSATSGGDANTLNSTGIGASGIAVGDLIENVTDGSYAIVLDVNTDDIETTPLYGGTGNTWDNSDVWAVNRFVVTLINYDVDGTTVLKREKVLIRSRSTDNLTVETVPSLARGYDGSTAQSFDADDYVYLFTVANSFDGVLQVMSDTLRQLQTTNDTVDTKVTNTFAELHGVSSAGSDAYVIALDPVVSSYTDGMVVSFEADVANTGNATLNAGGGAYNILKEGDQTLASGDIKAGQKVIVQWDAGTTIWQMQSQIGNPPIASGYDFNDCTAGENINASTAPLAVYVDLADSGQIKIADASVTSTARFHGFVADSQNVLDTETVSVRFSGVVPGFTGLTAGAQYYLSDTSGAISTSAGTVPLPVGVAISTTELFIMPHTKIMSGQGSRTVAAGTGTQDITHDLGVTPKLIKISAWKLTPGTANFGLSNGSARGIVESCTWLVSIDGSADLAGQTSGRIIDIKNQLSTTVHDAILSAVDYDTFTLDWQTASGGDTTYFQWEVYG